MSEKKAVVLHSGGVNSAVITAIARENYDVCLLHVRYGQRAQSREAELFVEQAKHFGILQTLRIDMPHFAAIGGNARVSRKLPIEAAMAIGDGPSNCYVPGLIGALATAAFTWARELRASAVLIGVSENLGPPAPPTSSIYPDYAREYVHVLEHLFETASDERTITLDAPLIDMQRSEIIKLGHRLDVPFELTWSCLSSAEEPCGACVGCATRQRGFVDASLPDPLVEAVGVST